MQMRHVLPEFTERTSFGVRTLDPYAKLFEERIVMLGTPVDEAAANDVIAQFLHLDYAAPERVISLYINSPGGSVTAMTAIYDTIRTVSCEVETICLGQAAGPAAVLLAAGTPGRRLALPRARIVLEPPALDEPVQGQPSDLDIQARELLRQRDLLAGLLAEHTGRERARVDADIDRTTVLDAAGARAYGLVDQVVRGRHDTGGADTGTGDARSGAGEE
ncbi:ATP-dependent Clp protease proteolytic subunit [Streptomyces sp. NPDC048717]|uniref:ATP-dependent Clp protease proteolytic subunit n=1 Tax=Streptomyces sp. NPDC048717 TaxID=3154928 RepID=UPI00343C83FA